VCAWSLEVARKHKLKIRGLKFARVRRWTYEFKPLRRRYWLVRRLLAPLWRRYMQAGFEAAPRVAEDRILLANEGK
jgi:hypothetical protein